MYNFHTLIPSLETCVCKTEGKNVELCGDPARNDSFFLVAFPSYELSFLFA